MENNTTTFSNIVNSSIATLIAEISTLPICTIKTNYQNTTKNFSHLTIVDITKQIYTKNGLVGFFSASPYAVISQMISSSSKFVFYKKMESLKLDYTGNILFNKMINGSIAGMFSSVITHPIEVGKITTQMGNNIFQIVTTDGIKVFYRGYSKSLIKSTIGSSLFIPLFDFYNTHIDNVFLASLGSAITSSLIIHPIDFVKTRHIGGLNWFVGYNPINYYKGLTLSLSRLVPHFIITMTTLDYLNKNIQKY